MSNAVSPQVAGRICAYYTHLGYEVCTALSAPYDFVAENDVDEPIWIKAVTQEWPSVKVRGTLWSEGLVAHLVMADAMPLLIMAKSGPGAWRSVKHNGVGWVTIGR